MREENAMVALRLRDLRQRRAWTQEFLAERAGVKQTQVSQWEGGRRRPELENVRKLAAAFDMTHEELARELGMLETRAEVSEGDIFDRAPLARLERELRALPTAKGQPTFSEQMEQLDRLKPAVRERMIRQLARDFRYLVARELEREEEEERRRQEEGDEGENPQADRENP